MKKLFVLAAAALFAFASCVKDNNSDGNEGPAKEATITLNFANETKTEYGSHDANDLAQGTELNNLTVFVLNSSGSIIKTQYITSFAEVKISTTTSATKIVAVGNTGNLTLNPSHPFNTANMSPNTLTTLRSKMGQLSSPYLTTDPVAQSGVTNRVWLTGESATFTWNEAAGVYSASTTLNLSVIPARIDVTLKDSRTKLDNDKAWILKEFYILYSADYTHFVKNTATGLVPTAADVKAITSNDKYYLVGEAYGWDNELDAEKITTYAPLKQTIATALANGDTYKKTFYVLPGGIDATDGSAPEHGKPVKLMFMAQQKDGVDVTKSYWTTAFNATDLKKFVQNGGQYKLSVEFKGDATTGGGTDEEEENPGDLTVDIQFAGWQSVDLTKVFGND